MKDTTRLKRLFQKYLRNECSNQELEELFLFIKEKPISMELNHILNDAWEELTKYKVLDDKHSRYLFDQIMSNTIRRQPKPSRHWLSPLRVAAAAIVVFAIGIFAIQSYWKVIDYQEVAQTEKIVKSNPRGQKMLISLEDGSTVKLNAESSIAYSTDFRNSREIELDGEAFFEVKKDPDHPFVVKTHGLTTRVLGTSFNVRSYQDENESSVVVETGKVSVTTPYSTGEAFLSPGQMITSNDLGLSAISEVANLSYFLGWKDNVLTFENADFDKIEKELSRWFNVEFEYEKKPVIKAFNGEFKNQSLEIILDGIQFSTDLQYRINNRKVIILN